LMHIILSGQPELADKLAKPGLAQLRQRLSIMHGLEPLPSWEVKNYIEHRLRVAGYEGESLLAPDTYEEIARFTSGITRNVNNFCFNALSLACALREKPVTMDVVTEVISDMDISRLVSGPAEEEYVAKVRVPAAEPARPPRPAVAPKQAPQTLSPAEAKAYMQQLALKLKSWQNPADKTSASAPRSPQVISRNDGQKS
jgi:hypothetical protein